MKKIIFNMLSLGFLTFCFSLTAQTRAEFQYTLYVEDARGKKDSVILGYDKNARSNTLETAFGESDISNRPFDSTLEIRAAEANNQYSVSWQSKKVIAYYSGDCYLTYAGTIRITLLIRAKYLPIKLSWNKDLFNDQCRRQSVSLFNEGYFAIDPNFQRAADSIYGVTYLSRVSERLESFPRRTPTGQVNQFYHFTYRVPLNNGTSDSIWTYTVVFRNDWRISTKESEIKNALVFPNPCIDALNIELPESVSGTLKIYDIAGRQVKNDRIQAQQKVNLNVSDLQSSLYYVRLETEDRQIFTSKFVKQ